jgi:hypothetical protein
VALAIVFGSLASVLVAAPATAGVPIGGLDFFVENPLNFRCLDADLNTIGRNGTVVQLWDCNRFTQQRWVAVRGTRGGIIIVNLRAKRCLDADAPNAFRDGARVQLWDCNASAQQEWYEAPSIRGNGLYVYVNLLSHKCLDADTNSIKRNGTKMQLWRCNGQLQQTFWYNLG